MSTKKNQAFFCLNSFIVIASVDAKTLYTKLLDPENVPSEFLTTIKGLKIGSSSVLVNLGVDIDLSAFGTFFKSKHIVARNVVAPYTFEQTFVSYSPQQPFGDGWKWPQCLSSNFAKTMVDKLFVNKDMYDLSLLISM